MGRLKVEEKTNPAFSPTIRSAGQSNTLRLDCSAVGCDFFANGELAGRSPKGISGKTKTIGLFTSSDWDHRFGKVEYKQLRIYAFTEGQGALQPFSIEDPLTSASEVFAGTGLSGAFNEYNTEGFHFSPVIPYGFYGVKGGPALGDMTVSATVKMEVVPGISGSRFAGLVCHFQPGWHDHGSDPDGWHLFHLQGYSQAAICASGSKSIRSHSTWSC